MDALEFPRFMCRLGGSWMLETGPHEVRTVADAAEAEKALSEGWKFSQYDSAASAFGALTSAEISEIATARGIEHAVTTEGKPILAPSQVAELSKRAALEARAKELGLTYHHRTGDEKLARLIAEAESK